MIRVAAVSLAFCSLVLAPFAAAETIEWIVTREAHVYDRTDTQARIVATLKPRTVVQVVEVTDEWIRVRSSRNPDGYLRRGDAEPFHRREPPRPRFQQGIFRLGDPAILRAGPDMNEPRVNVIPAGTEVLVVDQRGNWYRVESQSGKAGGWIPVISARRVGETRPSAR